MPGCANGGLGIDLTNAVGTGHQFLIDIAHAASPIDDFGNPLTPDADTIVGSTTPITLSNGSFEADSMAAGQPGVIENPLGNFALIDPQGWDVTGFGGVFAPTEAVIAATGHEGGHVVFLDGQSSRWVIWNGWCCRR